MTQKQKQKLKDSLNKCVDNEKKNHMRPGLKFINNFLAILILCSFVYFVISINDISVKGFILEDLKKQAVEFKEKNQNLELNIMEMEAYDNLIKRTEKLNMVKVDKIDYITVISGEMAKK